MGYGGYGKGKGGNSKGGKMSGPSQPGHFDVSEDSACLVLPRNSPALHTESTTFDIDRLEESAEGVSSYIWDVSKSAPRSVPRILIPGLPKSYQPCDKVPGKLKEDDGDLVAYEDHLRLPLHPMAAIYQAVLVTRPEFDLKSVDVVCDSNDIRKLCGFLRGDCSATSILVGGGVRDNSFKICVDLHGHNGILLTRVEQRDIVPLGDVPGCYGKYFVNEVARDMGEPGEMYRRISRLQLGDLSVIVRAEVDACEYKSEQRFQIDKQGTWQRAEGEATFEYMRQGEFITCTDGVFYEVKTKSERSFDKIDWVAYYLQMVFGGAEMLILGLHTKGLFKKPLELSLHQVRDKAKQGGLQNLLRQLELLLSNIRSQAQQSGGSLDIFCKGQDSAPLIVKTRGAC